MSALAWLLHQQGHSVSGSDCRETRKTAELREAGIDVHVGHDRAHVEHAEAVVYSSAIGSENVELQAAGDREIDILHRQELLAEIFNANASIGVAGTHGKTTTSAMIAALLSQGGIDPTFLIGAPTPTLGGNARVGSSRWLVSEVCESDGYFVDLFAELAVVTNMGVDHLDHYGSESKLLESFAQYISQSRKAILCADDDCYEDLKASAVDSLSFGIEQEADLVARNIVQNRSETTADLLFKGQFIGALKIQAPGKHNVLNAMAALLAGYSVGLTFPSMIEILEEFILPNRRFQILEENGLVIVDDYAHLPEQVELNLEAARGGWPERRLIAIFQPHRYSRMSYMKERFAEALAQADIVVVNDIYPAFESPIPGVCAHDMVESMRESHPRVHFAESLESTYEFLRKESMPGDFIIGFGAGDIWQVLHRIVSDKRT